MGTRVHPDLAELIRLAADDLDVTYSDYLAWILAGVHRRPDLSPIRPDHTQQELPLRLA